MFCKENKVFCCSLTDHLQQIILLRGIQPLDPLYRVRLLKRTFFILLAELITYINTDPKLLLAELVKDEDQEISDRSRTKLLTFSQVLKYFLSLTTKNIFLDFLQMTFLKSIYGFDQIKLRFSTKLDQKLSSTSQYRDRLIKLRNKS